MGHRFEHDTVAVPSHAGLKQSVYVLGGVDKGKCPFKHVDRVTFTSTKLFIWWLLHLLDASELCVQIGMSTNICQDIVQMYEL